MKRQLLLAAAITVLWAISMYCFWQNGFHAGHGKGYGKGKLKGFTLGVWYAHGDSSIITFTGERNWLLDNLRKEDSAMQAYERSKIGEEE